MILRRLVLSITLASAASMASQTTIHVPANQPTIQSAIAAANNGDTVLVSPGTYVENIDFLGKAITVTSTGGAVTTIIDGGNHAATVSFHHNEGRNSVLSNFTIQNGAQVGVGYGEIEGGIGIYDASPSILNNVITGNYAMAFDRITAAR